MAITPPEATNNEGKKRRREQRIAFLILVGFVASTLVQTLMTERREGYEFVQSLVYFSLLHFNVILVMLLLFLVTRNLTKAYFLRRSGRMGSSLRWKLVTSLLAFSLAPALLLFLSSTFIIREGFDRWFGTQVSKALEDARSISRVHYEGIEQNLNFFSERIEEKFRSLDRPLEAADLANWGREYPVEGIEMYRGLSGTPLRWRRSHIPEWAVPAAAVDSLQRALGGERFQLIRQYGDGDLVQEYRQLRQPLHVTQQLGRGTYILVISQTVPLGLKTRISELEAAFASYQNIFSLKDSLKTNYTLILLSLFLLILFVASWFGLYLARSVTDPVADLLKATEAFREGRWHYRIPLSEIQSKDVADASKKRRGAWWLRNQKGTADLETLKGAFNLMAEEVGRRGRKLEEANAQLTSLVGELEEREKYLEILLSSIRRGVLVLDRHGYIRRINSESLDFSVWAKVASEMDPSELLGKAWREHFASMGSNDEAALWLSSAKMKGGAPVDRIFDLPVGEGRSSALMSVRGTAIQLLDDRKIDLGFLLILEDVSDAARLERLAAWQEVARRVAHEIKNPLTPIQISADRLQRRMAAQWEEGSENALIFKECIGQIQKQVRVIRDLVREFSQFAKLPEPKMQNLPIAPLFEDCIKDYRFTHPNCEFLLSSTIPRDTLIRADPNYLRRLFVNLADNAIHSMEEAKTESPRFLVELKLTKGSWVTIVFEDNGPGISEAMRQKIFDPYISSKASGLGLGLAIVRRIAAEHFGKIRCERAQGGRFVFELPALSKESRV